MEALLWCVVDVAFVELVLLELVVFVLFELIVIGLLESSTSSPSTDCSSLVSFMSISCPALRSSS